MPTMRMSDSNKRARETFLFNITNNPRMAIEAAKDSFSSLKEIAGNSTVANANAVKIMTLFCSQFSRRTKKRADRSQSDPGKDKFLSECLSGVSALFDAFTLKEKPISTVASAWPSMTAWMAHIYEDVYPLEKPENQVAWWNTLMEACGIAAHAGLEINKLCRIVAELWIKVEDTSISRALWLCSENCRGVCHPTHHLRELGLSPDQAAELAVDRLLRAYKEYMHNPRPSMWTEVISLIYGCSALSNSPDASFGTAMLRKNVYSLSTRIIRNYRVRAATPAQHRQRSSFRIHALNALLNGIIARIDSDNGILSLSQSLRKGLIAVMVTALLSMSGLTENDRDSTFSVRRTLFDILPTLLAQKSIVSAAGKGMSYFTCDLVRKLSTSEFQPQWSKFEQLLLERFILYRTNCHLRQTEEYPCTNEVCGVVRNGSHMLKCAHCKTTVYCSRACQKQDWRQFDHVLLCAKTEYTRWNQRYLQTLASNAVIRFLPSLDKLATDQGLSCRSTGFIVMFKPASIHIGVMDLRNKRNWNAGYEQYYKDAADEAEYRPSCPRIMVVEVRYPEGDSDAFFMFSERFPTYNDFAGVRNCISRSSNGKSLSGEVMESRYNQLDCVMDYVRAMVRAGAPQLAWGCWTEEVVDRCIKSVDELYGSDRDIIGEATYYDNTYGDFLN